MSDSGSPVSFRYLRQERSGIFFSEHFKYSRYLFLSILRGNQYAFLNKKHMVNGFRNQTIWAVRMIDKLAVTVNDDQIKTKIFGNGQWNCPLSLRNEWRNYTP